MKDSNHNKMKSKSSVIESIKAQFMISLVMRGKKSFPSTQQRQSTKFTFTTSFLYPPHIQVLFNSLL